MSNYLQRGFRKTMLSKGEDPHNLLIKKFGEPYRAYRQLWEETLSGKIEREFPIHLDIELNPSCNLMCPMCVISAETNPKSSKKHWMPFDEYCKLVDEGMLKGLKSLQLNNINEPLIRKDLPRFVAYARDAGVLDIMLSTNGTALTKSVARRLIEAGLTKISVSLDATTKKTYDKIRVGGDFDKVMNNCHGFLELRQQMGLNLPLFKVTFVSSPINEGEKDEFIAYWQDRADLIAIQNLNNPFDDDLWEKTRDYFALEPIAVQTVERICPHPFQRMTIQADGEALLCCNLRGPELPLGNVIDKGLSAVYNNELAKSYRRLHAEGQYAEIETCRKCMQFSKVEENRSAVINLKLIK
jgi:radical SAM protein with 4Fe4S-binding SPASM domain